jgi:hypothetical protein
VFAVLTLCDRLAADMVAPDHQTQQSREGTGHAASRMRHRSSIALSSRPILAGQSYEEGMQEDARNFRRQAKKRPPRRTAWKF